MERKKDFGRCFMKLFIPWQIYELLPQNKAYSASELSFKKIQLEFSFVLKK